jgi:DNA integrity scanning protein DisA with diadenylate cyclase activity
MIRIRDLLTEAGHIGQFTSNQTYRNWFKWGEELMDMFNPFGGDITDQAVLDWLEQFNPEERPLIGQLLRGFKYYGSAKVAEAVRILYQSVLKTSRKQQEDMWFIPVGYVAKSGSIIAYYFRVQNALPQDHFVSPADLASLPLTEGSTVVFLDDFLGTGNQARQVWENVAKPIHDKTGADFYYSTLVAYTQGQENLKRTTRFLPLAVDVLNEADSPFSESSSLFDNEDDRVRCEQIVEQYGKRLYPNHPFGYQRTQGMVGFFYSTPNNTLPIFWASQNDWHPLLARGDSYRDPAFLIGPPPGLNTTTAGVSATTPIGILDQLDHFDIEWESLVRLGSEFKDSKVVLVLASILKELNIGRAVLESLLDLIRSLRDLRHEKEPVRSALHIVPNGATENSLGSRIFQAASGTNINSQSRILALANMTDGLDGAIVIRFDGKVVGNYIYPACKEADGFFLPLAYQKAAAASRASNGMVLVFLKENRIAIFSCGNRVLWHRGAAWHLQSIDIERGIRELSNKHNIEFPVLHRVIHTAFQLSDSGHGSLITVGDHPHVIVNSDPPKTDHVEWAPMDLTTPLEGLVGIMSQDGATIISGGGEIVQAMTTLRPPPGVVVREEIGRGTKHSTAAKISKVTDALCIAVSVDGRITVYSKGEIAFKVMG